MVPRCESPCVFIESQPLPRNMTVNYSPTVSSRTSSPEMSNNAKLELPTLTPNDIVIAVMGITGAGKSTFISYFAPDAKIGHELQSCTSDIGIHAATIGDKKCYLIDTPGFDDTNKSDTEILRQLADWLSRSYEAKIRLAGIVYLHRITDNRMGGTALKNLSIFKKLCGDDGLSCVVLATTMWRLVSPEEGERREHDLSTKQEYWAGMVSRGSKVLRLDKGVVSALAVIEHIFAQRRRITLDIQQEMADGKTLDETRAGQEVEKDLAALRQKHEQDMAIIREELEQELYKHDLQAKEELAQVRAELEKKLRLADQDRERLRVDMKTLQVQCNEELQKLRNEANKKEVEAQKQLMAAKALLDQARQHNEPDAQSMETKMQSKVKEVETARHEMEDVDRKRKKRDACVVM
ncbi:P-loop containing nucleoside triphosphate hydrolase protein [Trichoderma velutinum]